MKCTTAVAFLLACSPAAILAAPVADSSSLVARQAAGPGPGSSVGGSASQGLSGQTSGSEGVLGHVEALIKDLVSSVSSYPLQHFEEVC
jgi:hypothetical protein